MANTIHNLDENLQEYFEFIVRGHHYRFRQLNTEEMMELRKLQDKEDESKAYLSKFITKVDESAPDFDEVSKKMIMPQWIRFQQMIKTEFSAS